MKVAVVGAGISGLSAAHRLMASGHDMDVRVFEAADRPGGKIHTARVDRFVIEDGADSFLARKPQMEQLCRTLGIEDQLCETKPATRGAYVAFGPELFPLPDGMSGLVPGDVSRLADTPLLSEDGKRRALAEPDVPAAGKEVGEETVAEFVSRRFGREVYDALVEPLLCGIYAGDGERLSAQATIPTLVEIEAQYGSLSAGLARQDTAGAGTGFRSLRGGMGILIEHLAESIGSAIEYASAVDHIEPAGDQWQVRAEQYDAVVVSCPAPAAARLLAAASPSAAEELATFRTSSTAVVSLGFPRAEVPTALDRYGYVIPRREGVEALACTWSSAKLEGRAPDGYALLRVFVGRDGQPADAWSDAELSEIARTELLDRMGIVDEPVVERISRYDHVMPQYDLGHTNRVASVRQALQEPGRIHIVGCAYDGVGIPDCIQSGWDAADALIAESAVKRTGANG